MAKPYATLTMAALKGQLLTVGPLNDLIQGRVVDEPQGDIEFPYVRFGAIEPSPDDTDGARGAVVQVGLEVHSRPIAGRIEAAKICEILADALHKKPELLNPAFSVEGLGVSEIEVQTWSVSRGKDGETYEGRVALAVHIDN